jgi:hypothetical protein
MAGNDLLEAARQIGRQDNLAPGLAATGGLRRGVWAKMPLTRHSVPRAFTTESWERKRSFPSGCPHIRLVLDPAGRH